jgi:ATP-dependent Zn protease
VDPKKLKTAYHETAHAVMALICGLKLRRVSIKGTDSYHGITSTEPPERQITNPQEALREVRVSLAGFIGEVMISGKYSIFATHSDLVGAVEMVEDMLEFDDGFKGVVADLAVKNPGTLTFIENPLVRACIEGKLAWCLNRLNPYKPAIESIAEKLYESEELTGDEVAALFDSFTQARTGAPSCS